MCLLVYSGIKYCNCVGACTNNIYGDGDDDDDDDDKAQGKDFEYNLFDRD